MSTSPQLGSIAIGASDADVAEFWASFVNCDRGFDIPVEDQGPIPFQSLPPQIQVNGLSLLLDIGVACTSPHHTGMHSLFSLLKYPGIVSPQASFLFRVSTAQIDTHKKKVISDEFGCGMAFSVARQVFGKTEFLDFQTAAGLGLVTTAAPQSRQPDYLAWGPSLPAEIMLLEAKGTQTSLAYGISQISSACEQLQAANVIANGFTQTRVAVATVLMREAAAVPTTIYIGDPDSRSPYEYILHGDAKQAIQRSHYARVSEFLGDQELARRLDVRSTVSGRERVRRVVMGNEVLGTTLRFGSSTRQLEIFVGITNSVRSELILGNMVRTDKEVRLAHGTIKGRRSLAVRHGDGCCLEVSQIS